MKHTVQISCLIGLIIVLLDACKDDFKLPTLDVLYELEITGREVKFNNSTVGGTSYRWEFGDGETSTEENPNHIYPGKGKYVATLYVTANNGEILEGSTVIRISKSSPIKINDNSFADWDTITANVIQPGDTGGVIKEIKLDYDGNYIYLYGALVTKIANKDIFDFYIDSDDDLTTGLLTSTFAEGAYDILLEGPILSGNMDIFYHIGEQSDFSFDTQSISGAYSLGTVVENASEVHFEMQIDRTKLKGLTGKGMRLGINVVKNDWSASIGFAPAEGDPAFYLNMED